MATLGSLIVSLVANTTKFEEGLGRAAYMAQKRSGQINKVLGHIGFAGGLVGVTAFVKSGIDAADSMYNLAQKSGLATEQFSALNYAAGLSDVSAEDLAGSIGKLSKTMVAAAEGSGAASAAFASLGIKVKNSSGHLKGADTVILDVAERFSKMQDSAEKTALAMAIFGKSGAAMIPMLNEGRIGIERLSAEALRLGVVVDDKTGQAADKFNDQLDKLKAKASGLAIVISGPVIENLNKLGDEFDRVREKSGFLTGLFAGLKAGMLGMSADEQALSGMLVKLTSIRVEMERSRQAATGQSAQVARGGGGGGARLSLTATASQLEEYGELVKKISLLQGKIAGVGDAKPKPIGEDIAIGSSRAAEAAAAHAKKIQDVVASLQFEREQLGRSAVVQQVYNNLKAAGVEIGSKDADKIGYETVKLAEETAAREELNQRMADGLKIGDDMVQQYYDRQAALADQVEGFRVSALSGIDAEQLDYTTKLEALGEFYQGKADLQEEWMARYQELTLAHNQNISAIETEANQARLAAEDFIMQRKIDSANLAADLLQTVAGKSRVAAFAAIAFSKGVAIAQIIMNGYAASVAALAPPPMGLGPVAGAPLAASIKLWTRVQASLVGATGIAQFAGGGGGAIQSTRGSLPSVGGAGGDQAAAAPARPQVTISLRDDQIFSGSAVRTLIEKINDALGDGAKLNTA